ncbi:plastocyanin/azurin family copper-binding protein [Planococcus sp. APC 3906]|uniref:plastocyanin/azurin family copper-binding protein n=1 Tax=Planococcus sp. APC 3906 TaxID=3035194 RepID=UPI0025B36C0D|nr:plastocyanin/azurin family copper-binding protein [Planococcus sp. APC 3906]MDN3450361.1 plastocyanin/azurin family copper-binding protein [Planococcus sp. APC 3906]
MINKKFGLILAAGILALAACGEEEQPAANEATEVEEQESAPAEEAAPEAEEEMPEEDADEEEPAEDETDEASAEAPEAMSGAASALLANGETTSFVFNEAGEFAIFCEPHPVMKMTVVVDEDAEQMDEVEIDIADYEFVEETITIAPGTTIVWTNQDQVQHNVAIK